MSGKATTKSNHRGCFQNEILPNLLPTMHSRVHMIFFHRHVKVSHILASFGCKSPNSSNFLCFYNGFGHNSVHQQRGYNQGHNPVITGFFLEGVFPLSSTEKKQPCVSPNPAKAVHPTQIFVFHFCFFPPFYFLG